MLALLVVATLVGAASGTAPAQTGPAGAAQARSGPAQVSQAGPAGEAQAGPAGEAGRRLYLRDCAGCHGPEGRGSFQGPPVAGVGGAGAHFWLATGRMPITDAGQRPVRRPPAYPPQEIDALVAYVASLGPGPAVPSVDPDRGDLAGGGHLYRLHCAPCHSATGIGGALAYGETAPALFEASAVEVAASMIVAPGAMPAFDPATFGPAEVDAIAAYVLGLREPARPGGLPLGSTGRVDEGLVAWAAGVAGLMLAARWVARRP